MLRLTNDNGDDVFVNPHYIILMTDFKAAYNEQTTLSTTIQCVGEIEINVRESVDTVIALLTLNK